MLPEGFRWTPHGTVPGRLWLVRERDGLEVGAVGETIDGRWLSTGNRHRWMPQTATAGSRAQAIRWLERWATVNAERLQHVEREKPPTMPNPSPTDKREDRRAR